MKADNHLKFEKDGNKKTKYELTYCSNNDAPFEKVLYLTEANFVKSHSKRKPVKSISSSSKYISGIYIADVEHPNIGYGDYDNDALLFLLDDKLLEILVFKNKKNVVKLLYSMFINGDFTDQMKELSE